MVSLLRYWRCLFGWGRTWNLSSIVCTKLHQTSPSCCHVVLGLLYMNCDIAYIYDNLKGRGILNLWFIVISTDLRHTKYPTSRCDQSYGILICKYYQIIRTNSYACCNILMSTTWILRQENLFSSRAREESLDTIKRQNSPL